MGLSGYKLVPSRYLEFPEVSKPVRAGLSGGSLGIALGQGAVSRSRPPQEAPGTTSFSSFSWAQMGEPHPRGELAVGIQSLSRVWLFAYKLLSIVLQALCLPDLIP